MTEVYVSLFENLDSSENKRESLISWTTDSLSSKAGNASFIVDDVVKFMKKLVVSEGTDIVQYESKVLAYQLSHVITLCLKELYTEEPSKVYDISTLAANILAERFEEVVDDPSLKKKFKKHKSTHVYSVVKDYALTLLCSLYENFSHDLKSLSPLVLSVLFKDLKKCLDKSKYFNSNYIISLMRLFQAISSLSSEIVVETQYVQKFMKLSKEVISDVKEGKYDYPVDFITAIIESFPCYFCGSQFLSVHKSDILKTLYYKLSEYINYSCGVSPLRIPLAKTLAEILHFYVKSDVIKMENVLEFYGNIISEMNDRVAVVAVIHSVHQFLCVNLCDETDFNFSVETELLGGDGYLVFLDSFFPHLKFNREVRDHDYIEACNIMHKQVLPFLSDGARGEIIRKVLNNTSYYFSPETVDRTLLYMDFISLLLEDSPSSVRTDDDLISKIISEFTVLCSSKLLPLRIKAVECLKRFIMNIPYIIRKMVEDIIDKLSVQFELEKGFNFAENHGLALLLASIIVPEDEGFISPDLIIKVTGFAIGTLKSNSLSTKPLLYEKELLCWILLTGCLCYQDSEYTKIHSSQLFIFWRNILTHTAVFHNDEELLKNIEIRNHSLSCMISFLRSNELNEDVAKQIFYLMSKCMNFKHSLVFENKLLSESVSRYEHRIYQVFLLICPLVHKDVSTSALLPAIRNFSNPVSAGKNVDLNLFEKNIIKSGGIDVSKDSILTVLCDKNSGDIGLSTLVVPCVSSSMCSLSLFEELCLKAIPRSRSFDYSHIILDIGAPPPLNVALVDVSLELFSLCFPYTNTSVQRSLLETLNSNLLTNKHIPSRRAIIKANILFSLHLTLNEIQKAALALDPKIAELLMIIMEECSFADDDHLYDIKSRIASFICAAVKRSGNQEFGVDTVNILINRIVEKEEPILRGMNLNMVCEIFKDDPTSGNLNVIMDIVEQFLSDKHPVIHTSGLNSLIILLMRRYYNDKLKIGKVMDILFNMVFSNDYEPGSVSGFGNSYNSEFNMLLGVGNALKALTEVIGPDLRNIRVKFKAVLSSLNMCPCSDVQAVSLKISELVSMFKMETLFNFKMSMLIVRSLILSFLKRGMPRSGFKVSVEYLLEMGNYEDVVLNRLVFTSFLVFPKYRSLRKYIYGWLKHENRLNVLLKIPDMSPYALQFLLEVYRDLIGKDEDLSSILKICYTASVSNIPSLQVSGLELVKKILDVYEDVVDPEDESSYLLEQYTALITGVVNPLFSRPSYPEVICCAFDICAVSLSNRVVSYLVDGLLEVAENKPILKIGASEFPLNKKQLQVKLSILRAWANTKGDFVKEYLNVLVPLWIITIREHYSPEIVDSLCAQDPSIINNFDLEGFVFVMFGEILP
ncbi:hypothetical protein KLMA_10144 [Kluyveromyces marxianus]|nr:hypothetical protein KLMA_10144 [Kluyveromyces marxianus]